MRSAAQKAVGPAAEAVRRERYQRPASYRRRRMAARFVSNTFAARVHTPSGLFLGNVLGYHVDMPTMNRVAAKIMAGVYYLELGRRVPADHIATGRVEPSADESQEPVI